jgi:preprotein translocase subunit YajC
MGGFLIIVIILAAFWLLAVLPRRRRMQSHQAMQDSLEPGNEVITAGGLHGIVSSLEDGEVRLQIAENVIVTVDRRAVAAVAAELPAEPEEQAPGPEDPAEPS